MNKTDRTKLKLDAEDTALVFRANGELEIYLISDDEDRNIADNEMLTMAISMHLSDPQFVRHIITATQAQVEKLHDTTRVDGKGSVVGDGEDDE